MSTAPSPGNGRVFAYYEPVTNGMAVKKSIAPPEWLDPGNTTLACAECGSSSSAITTRSPEPSGRPDPGNCTPPS